MSITAEKSFLIDLLQNSTDIAFIQKVKRFVLREMDSIMKPNEDNDQVIVGSTGEPQSAEVEHRLEVQKIIEIWTDYSQHFRSAPHGDLD